MFQIRSFLSRYGIAFLVLALATLLRLLLDPILGDFAPFVIFFGATMLVTWYGGVGPALFTLAGGVLLASYLFVPPRGSLWIGHIGHWSALGLYLLVVLVVIALTESFRRSREQVEIGERQFRRMLEGGNVGIGLVDEQGGVQYANPALLQMLGYTAEEVAAGQLRWDRSIVPEFAQVTQQALRELRAAGSEAVPYARYEKECIAKDGRRVPVLVSFVPLERTDDGWGTGAVFVTDLTAIKQTEAALQEANRTLGNLVRAAPLAVTAINRQLQVTLWNPAAERLFGWRADEVMGQPLPAIPEEWKEAARSMMEEDLGGAVRVGIEKQYLRKDGSRFDARMWTAPLRDGAGQITGTIAIFEDITAPLQAREEARRSRELLERVFEGTHVPLAYLDRDFNFLRVNRAYAAADERTPDFFIGKNHFALYSDAENEAIFRRVVETGEPFGASAKPFVYPEHPERGVSYWDWWLEPIKDRFGRTESLVSSLVNVTEATQARQALQEREAQLKEAQRIAHIGSWEWNKESGTVTWSEELYNLFGLDLAHPVLPWELQPRFFVQGSRERWMEAAKRCLETGEPYELDLEIIRAGGERRWIVGRGEIRRDAGGRIVGMRGTAQDVTERMQAEAERERLLSRLAEADRRKDEFLATLAHELRNPLAPISNAFTLIRRSPQDSALIGQALDMGERQVGLLVRLVDDLVDIVRITRGTIALRKQQVMLQPIIQCAVEASRPHIEAGGHQLAVDLPGEPVWLEVDFTRIVQVVTNLLVNSAKYTETGGHIRLTACREGDEVVIAVQDDGIGIPEDLLSRVFDLFVQRAQPLHQIWRGLGAGLPLVKSLVELHGGRVEAASPGVGQGSTFTLRLPGVIASPVEAPPVAAAAPVRSRRILVVDDDRDVADSMAMLLTTCGHEVRTAYDGAAALALAPRYRPEAVLLDLGMPGMDGYAVARALRQRPELHETLIVALTGWGQEEDRRRSREAGFDHHLVKPVDPDRLEAVLSGAPADGNPR